MTTISGAATVDDYIKNQPQKVQPLLQKFRQVIRSAAPDAEEVISYQIPGYKYFGMLVYFGAWENHIGFYPGAGGIAAFRKELSGYKSAKGSVQFPFAKPVPYNLINKIVKFRLRQNEDKVGIRNKQAASKRNSGK